MTINKNSLTQKVLHQHNLAEFYHSNFVRDQVRDFLNLVGDLNSPGQLVTDMGGGCGFFAIELQGRSNWRVRVLDMDPISVNACRDNGIEADLADALSIPKNLESKIVSFNLMLHHLVGNSISETRELQISALRSWHEKTDLVFVNEYIYESWLIERFSGWLIYVVTSNQLLSMVGRVISRFVPSLRANTFGTGVRFRAKQEWIDLFDQAGFDLVGYVCGTAEKISFPRRMLLINDIRRDSFLMRPRRPRNLK